MRTVLLLLAAVAWAAATMTGDPRGMESNREYWYDYDSQMLNGIPILNMQYSGVKIRARIMMQVAGDGYIMMKMSSPRIYKVRETHEAWSEAKSAARTSYFEESDSYTWSSLYDRRDENRVNSNTEGLMAEIGPDTIIERRVSPTEWLPESLLEEFPSEYSTLIAESLVTPIKFKYDRGIITKVYADQIDPYWSVNIKKGVLSMMYLDLNAMNRVSEVNNSPVPSFLEVVNRDYTVMSAKTAFTVMEPSTMGDCETIYSIIPDGTLSELRVTKVPNVKKCMPKIMAESGLFSSVLSIPGLEGERELLEPSMSMDYILGGSRHEFKIMKAVVTAKYTFSPSVNTMGSMAGYCMQQLTFVKEESIGHPISFETSPVLLKDGLKTHIPLMKKILGDPSTWSTEETSRRVSESEMSQKIEMIDRLLTMVVEKTRTSVEDDVPDIINAIVQVCRRMPIAELKTLVETYCKRTGSKYSPGSAKREILLDIIPTVPHPEIVSVIKYIVTEEMTSANKSAMMISTLTMVCPPTPMIIYQYVDMVKSSTAMPQIVKKALILGIGAVGNKLRNIYMKMKMDPARMSAVIKGAVKELKAQLSSSSMEMKSAVIKAIGNLGSTDLLSDLERIIKEKSEPEHIRSIAVYAMCKMTNMAPKEIISILLPVYLDQNEPTVERVAAYTVIMMCKPGHGVLHMMGNSLNIETNIEVSSYVYSSLQTLARSSIPTFRHMRTLVRKVLMVIRPVKTSPWFTSKHFHYEMFDTAMDMGLSLDYSDIFKVHRAIPNLMGVQLKAQMFGTEVNLLESYLEMKGIDEIMRKLVGMKGIWSEILKGDRDMSELLRPLMEPERAASIFSELTDMLSKVNLPSMDMETPSLSGYFKVLNNFLATMDMEKADMTDFLDIARRYLPLLVDGLNMDMVKTLPMTDSVLILPTPTGLPISINHTITTVLSLKGRVSLEGLISRSAPVKLKVDIKPSLAVDMHIRVGFNHDLFKVATAVTHKLRLDAPVNMEIECMTSEKKIVIKNVINQSLAPRLSMKAVPVVLTHFMPMGPAAYNAESFREHLPMPTEIRASEKLITMHSIEKEYMMPMLESKAKVKVIASRVPTALWDPFVHMLCKQELTYMLEPTSSTPEHIITEIDYSGTSEMTRSRRSGSWFSSWFSSDEAEPVEELSTESRFMPVTPCPAISEPITKKIMMEMKAVGGSTPMSVKCKLTLIRNPCCSKHQINLQMIGKSIPGLRMDEVLLMSEAYLDLPEIMKTFLALRREDETENKLISSFELSYGVSSFTENMMKLKIMPHMPSEDPQFPLEYRFKSNKELAVKTINVKIMCEATEGAKRIIMPVIDLVLQCPQMRPYNYFTEAPLSSIEPGKANLHLQIIPKVGKANCIMAMPSKTVYVVDWPLPSIIKPHSFIVPVEACPKDVPALPDISSLTKMPNDMASAMYGICKLRGTHVETIDKLSMALPSSARSSGCEIVLAHDCSPQKLYMVTSTPIIGSSVSMVKIIVPKYKVELLSGPTHTSGMIVKVNGVTKHVTSSEPAIETRIEGESIVELLKIVKKDGVFKIYAPEIGLAVVSDGTFVDTMVSPLMLGTMCGLCSHIPKVHAPLSASVSIIPKKPVEYSTRTFLGRYLVSSASCPVPSSASASSSNTARCEVVRRNIKIRRTRASVPEVCFSLRPIEVCPDFCRPVQTLPQTVGFHCLPESDMNTVAMIRASQERVLSELINKTPDIHEEVTVVQQCVS